MYPLQVTSRRLARFAPLYRSVCPPLHPAATDAHLCPLFAAVSTTPPPATTAAIPIPHNEKPALVVLPAAQFTDRRGVHWVPAAQILTRRFLGSSPDVVSESVRRGVLADRELAVTNFAKEDKGIAVLAGDIFDVPIRRDIVHRVVVWQLAKRRQGTHSTLTISEVSGTGKKPGPQKGSGRARHGTLRGPQFRGGANVHGPKPRDYEQGLQKKVRRLGLKVALSARLAEGKLKIFENIVPPSPKTRDMVQIITGMEQCRKILFVEESEKVNEALCRATKNIHFANVLPVKGLNVYSILQHDTVVMTLGAVRALEDRLHTPINR